jgi:hypothetical protein
MSSRLPARNWDERLCFQRRHKNIADAFAASSPFAEAIDANVRLRDKHQDPLCYATVKE